MALYDRLFLFSGLVGAARGGPHDVRRDAGAGALPGPRRVRDRGAGAAGGARPAVRAPMARLGRSLGHATPHGFNLIHSPNEPELEAAVVALYLRRGVRLVEASAYLDLTLPVVRYRVHGLRVDGS